MGTLDEMVTLTSNGDSIQLPLVNILRISMVHLTKLLSEFTQETQSKDILEFWKWMEKKLEMGKGKVVLT